MVLPVRRFSSQGRRQQITILHPHDVSSKADGVHILLFQPAIESQAHIQV